MKNFFLWVTGVVLTPIILFLILTIALYLPPVQNWAVHTVAEYASENTGMEISVERVCLVFPLDLGVDGVKVIQPNDSLPNKKDTIADLHQAVVNLQLLPLIEEKINIDRFDIYGLKVNTVNFIHEARVKGYVGALTLTAPNDVHNGIDLSDEFVELGKVSLSDAKIDVALSDTVPEDTTKSDTFWKIRLADLVVKNSDVSLHMPGDTLQIGINLGDVSAHKGYFDLYKGQYDIASFDWKKGAVKYDNVFEQQVSGLDPNHIALSNIAIGIDSLHFMQDKSGKIDFKVNLRQCAMKEKSGIAVKTLTTKVAMDTAQIRVADLRLITETSRLTANVVADLNVADSVNPGKVDGNIEAYIGKGDLMLAMGDMPKAFREQWPNQTLNAKLVAKGNMKKLNLHQAYLTLPTAFTVKASGNARNIDAMIYGSKEEQLLGNVRIEALTQNLNFVKTLLDKSTAKMVNLPALHAVAEAKMIGNNYDLTARLTEGAKGKANVKASVSNGKILTYDADIDIDNLQLQHFIKGMGLGGLTASAKVKGSGTDIFSPRTRIDANAKVSNCKYSKWNFNNMRFDALLAGGKASVSLKSKNQMLDGIIALNALMKAKNVRATLTTELNRADLYNMHVVDTTLTLAGCAHLDIETDLDEYYKVQGMLSDLSFIDTAKIYRPDDMILDMLTRKDTTHAVADCGDFHLRADVSGGYKKLLGISGVMMKELKRQWNEKIISEVDLRRCLPISSIYLSLGDDNPIARSLRRLDIVLSNVFADITTSPINGINGRLSADTIKTSTIQIDAIRAQVKSDAEQMKYNISIENGPKNPQYTFRAFAEGRLKPNGTSLTLDIDDDKTKRIVSLGLSAEMQQQGIRFALDGKKHILGYKDFTVNDDNYMFMARDLRVYADVKLRSSDGMGLAIYTDEQVTDTMFIAHDEQDFNQEGYIERTLQDITFTLHKFNLAEIVAVIPYMPKVSGVANGDFHVIQTNKNLSISGSAGVDNLVYEGTAMGNLSSDFVYMPLDDGTHHIDGLLTKDDQEIANIMGGFKPAADATSADSINLTLSMSQFPLDIANGFVPDKIVGLTGYGDGEIYINGTMNKPVVDGEVFLHEAALISTPYGIKMRFDDDPVRIDGSQLLLENFQMYANNNQPLIIMGNIDFSDLDHLSMNIKMRAQDFLLIDAKENRRSEAYGKGYINFYGMMSGELDKLQVKGQLEILPKTDLYYILHDSPITTDNRMKELVTFTDFSFDDPVKVARPTVDGLNVAMAVNVKDGAHIKCWLNTNHTNFLDILGGGDMVMRYSSSELSLTGRYTISSGQMKYSLPIIPLKTFTITDGSYIEFNGNMMNPRLNIEANEENKANVEIDGVQQSVLFNCGIKISKTLQDMGLEFIIDAPENNTLSDQLKSMSLEERGKLAVTMLTTGMYLTESNTSNFTMNSALSSFLQSEINQLAGSALRTLDVSIGMENTADETGHMHTDYSFKFAKRFWNNRLSISVGGKISTGPEVSNQNNTFFDNVELQYRTSDNSNQYLQLFYKRAVYDYLEGYVGQYGGGYIWKRKLQNFRDIFQFGDRDRIIQMFQAAKEDTIKTDSVK